jgi:hypothetical protein
MVDTLHEKRSEPRSIIDTYYSVEFLLSDCSFVYQYKIWNISKKGVCVLVKEDSDLLNHVKVGDVLNLRYRPVDASRPIELLRTEIKHITKDEQGRFKGVYLVGLSILEEQDPKR